MQHLHVITAGAMLIVDNLVHWVGTAQEAHEHLENLTFIADEIIDCEGKTILPGFVDSHTHIVFAGNRSHEFARRLRGATYQDIAAEGGGILATMRAVRNSSVEEIAMKGIQLAISAMKYGTTTIEIKSGYGLSLEAEMKLLQAIQLIKQEVPLRIVSTFMGAHDFPPEARIDATSRRAYIDVILNEMLPRVAEEKLAEFCDVFTDKGYYTLDETEEILAEASRLGLKTKVHADELYNTESARLAAQIGASSADHLLCISEQGMKALAESDTVATLLPGTAYFLGLPYAPARRLISSGACVAIASDCNPGSCFSENMQLMMSLACTQMKMSMEETLHAATINGAKALHLDSICGSLEVGKSADFVLMNTPAYTDVMYHFGVNHAQEVWIAGRREIVNY